MIGGGFLPLEWAALATLIVVAVIPNGVWRWVAVLATARLHNDSPFFSWVRHVATCLVAGVVAQLLLLPSGALAAAPGWLRFGALGAAAILWFVGGRNIFIAWAAGVALFTLGAALL